MAYDPNDAADKKIVDKLIADALAAQAEEHEAEVEGLKAKRTELINKLKAAREGKDDVDTSKLEGELETTKAALKAATKELNTLKPQLETLTGERDSLNKNLESVLIDNGLTGALTEHKVDAKYLPAVKALLSPKVALKMEGDTRKAVVGDKSLGDFIKEWSQGDEGKAYIAAPGNSGGGAGGGAQGGQGGGKKLGRTVYEQMPLAERATFMSEGGTLFDDA